MKPSCRRLLLALTLGSVSCGGGESGPDAAPDLPAWEAGLPPAGESMGVRRGLTPARGIIHYHTPYSHDACDGDPRDPTTGAVNEECLNDSRDALCTTRMDFAAQTDHSDSMAEAEFEDLFLLRDDDTLLLDADDHPIAKRMHCDNGQDVVMFVGAENDLMPIMLDRHPDGTPEERHAIYDAEDAATMELFRSLGGLACIAHTEQRSLEKLQELSPDGIEIYQLHANLDPDIRQDYLGLDPAGAIQAVAEFADSNPGYPESDLALLAFLEPSDVAVGRWDALLGEGRRVFGTAATDAHRNSFPIMMPDGERGDSYRRMFRWFSNVVLVEDPRDAIDIEAAVAAGRMFAAFEVFGTPSGFDAVATGAPASPIELGGEVGATAGATLEVTLPTVYELDASLPAPSIRARILRVDASGTTEVAEGATPTVIAPLDAPGAYRVEVLITPQHLGPYLHRLGPTLAEREQVWIYANPIYVTD